MEIDIVEKVIGIKENRRKSNDFRRFYGGDYRTRICDLLRVKIRMNIKLVLLCPFGAV